ncbi:MAG: hypothetical protein ACRDNS_16815, partial [Trebonia sp.]
GRQTAWFAAKRPSSGDAVSERELAIGWRSTANGPANGSAHGPGYGSGYGPANGSADGVSDANGHADLTSSGLPRRVPRTSAHPALDLPGSVEPFAPPAARPPIAPRVLAAPLDGTPPQGVTYQEAVNREQAPSRRRSPDAARSLLSGFQLGGREAAQAGDPTERVPFAGEENSR